MSDWELVTNSGQDNNPISSEWELNVSPQKETFGEALTSAPGRITEDVGNAFMSGINAIPSYYESAKTEVPGAFNVIREHPLHALSQLGAGFSELGKNLFNTPHDIVNYLSSRLNLVPEDINKIVQMARMPEDTNQMINQTFGEPKYPGEELIRGSTRNALNLLGGRAITKTLNPLNLTAKEISKNILKAAEENKNKYGSLYNNLWKEADKKGFGDLSEVVPSIDIKSIRKYSPKKSIAGIEEFIKNPNLQNAHTAKSDLLRMQRDLGKLTTLRTAERQQLKAVTDAIENIQSNMFKTKEGVLDPKMLQKYNEIQQGYARNVVPYKNKAIGQFKRNEISAKELVNKLSSGEFMAKVGKKHPALKIRPYIVPGSAALIAYPPIKSIYDALIGKNETIK